MPTARGDVWTIPPAGYILSTMSTTGERIIPAWTFGDRVRKAREKAGLTQAEMADLLHVSRKTLNHYELDRTQPQRPIDFIEALAEATGVSTAWLMWGADESYQGFRRYYEVAA